MIRFLFFSFVAILALDFRLPANAAPVQQWDCFEVGLTGPSDGNPFLDVQLSAQFYCGDTSIPATGFYDGDGKFKVRCMPTRPGTWHYTTHSNAVQLDGREGEFEVVAPRGVNHGPVRTAHTYHFAYADGSPYRQIGTTCYAWIHQDEALQRTTLKTLAEGPFNKLRFCVFPKRYTWNQGEPQLYPFEGTPPNRWNLERFNPEFFRHLEECIVELQELGIE
ncbi:MAG: DUF5060 domain-containing protein, partial [Planctomycetales bacterium]|nr:DUF5060 domain-containing protein [Planctomycetales bacterium]